MPAFSLWPFPITPSKMAAEQHMFDIEYCHHEPLEEWHCPYCFKIISSSRPPIFNQNNCGCVEAGMFANGNDEQSDANDYEQRILHDPTRYYQRSRSSTSSSVSISCPEGPEREEPRLNFGNGYLLLGPDVGLNETQHRRSASFHSNMSYQMRRFLVEGEPSFPNSVGTTSTDSKFLSQDIHIQSQRLKKAKTRSKLSCQSTGSGSVDPSPCDLGGDIAVAVGAQFDQIDILKANYPMTMSGMSDSQSEE